MKKKKKKEVPEGFHKVKSANCKHEFPQSAEQLRPNNSNKPGRNTTSRKRKI